MTDDILGEKIVISKVLVRNGDGEFLVVREERTGTRTQPGNGSFREED